MPLYLITSPQGKQYVGITTLTVNRRMTGHKTAARLGSPYPLHAAIRKYGFDAMTVTVLHTTVDLTELHALEVETIAKLNTQSPNGYNLTAGGEGTLNHIVTDAHKLHLSKCMSERWNDPDFVKMRKQKASEHASRASATPASKARFQAASSAYWTPARYAERAEIVSEKQKALWSSAAYRDKHLPRIIERNKSSAMRAASSVALAKQRAEQSPERRHEIAMLAAAKRAENKAAREAYLDSLPPEEALRLRAEAKAKKSAETSAGRASATPEQKEASRERYRQAALRRTPEQRAKLKAAQQAGIAAAKLKKAGV